MKNSTNNTGSNYSEVSHFLEDIYIVKINSDRSLRWMQKIPKKQISGLKPLIYHSQGIPMWYLAKLGPEKGATSYKYFNINSQHYYIFMDDNKNINLSPNDEPKPHNKNEKGIINCYTLNDNTGSKSRQTLINTKNPGGIKLYQFTIFRLFKISDNEIGVEFYKKKKEDVMTKVQF